jgi:hypothetical protein
METTKKSRADTVKSITCATNNGAAGGARKKTLEVRVSAYGQVSK